MSNDDLHISPKQGWLRVKLHSHSKWHRRYCSIDWDKAILFIASKADRRHREWLKLLPHIVLNDCESSSDNTIEIKSDNESHFLQAESRAEYEQWCLALKRTAYSRIGGGIFGQSLESTYKYSREKSSPVPLIVRQCCEFLLEHGSTFVGLFRVPGKQSSIKELRDMYDRGLVIELNECYSPATISSLLKIYLHSLPEPIIPVKHFDEFFEFGSRLKYNQTQDIDRLKRLIDRTLSGINHALLAYLCLFLKKLTHYAHETKMDTDNLAVTFGNNLIRPAEELDLNMIKGHNYNLFPLIKVFIDHSEYLFLINSSSTSETNNESIAKSSGFSSFSSLLSTNEQPPKLNSRSSSMPSIRFTTFSSVDSSHLSSDDQLDAEPRSQPVMASDAGNEQSFLTCCEEGEEDNDKPINLRLKRFSCVDGVNDDARTKKHSVVFEQRHRSDISPPIICSSSSAVSSPARKSSKKTFANKVGKSLSSFKTSMTRAFHPQLASTENLQYSSTINISAQLSAPLHEGLKGLQDEIRTLKQLITRKEVLLHHVTKSSQDDRLKYERENLELRQRIEQLQAENTKLKACHESDI